MGKIDLMGEDKPNLDKIANLLDGASDSDEKAYSEEIKSIQAEFLQERLESERQDRIQRGRFAVAIFGFMCIYMVATMIIVYLNGRKILDLSEAVVVTLLGTTTVNVIGVFVVVAKYLFFRQDQ